MIYVLIPSYNDSRNFPRLLKNINDCLNKRHYRVIIVSDGSTDNTAEIVGKLGISYPLTLLSYRKNQGPGFAFKYGFNYLFPKLKEKDIVVTMEADNTADFRILNTMLTKINDYDVVLASPYIRGGKLKGVSTWRQLISRLANFIDAVVFHVSGVQTYSSFYRVFKSEIIFKIKKAFGDNYISEDGFSVFVELLIKLNKIGARIIEVPATVDWRKRQGVSKNKLFKSFKNHLRLYYNYLTGKYHIG